VARPHEVRVFFFLLQSLLLLSCGGHGPTSASMHHPPASACMRELFSNSTCVMCGRLAGVVSTLGWGRSGCVCCQCLPCCFGGGHWWLLESCVLGAFLSRVAPAPTQLPINVLHAQG
jgi:hypothetical protein